DGSSDMWRALTMIRRQLRVARVLGSYGVLPPPEWAALAPPQVRLLSFVFPKSKARMQGRSGQRLARALTELGPSYIKAGQFLATRPDIIGAPIASDLSELQDRLPPFDLEEARRTLIEELGEANVAALGSLSPAVAAASIAQVHKVAVTKDDGVSR